MEDILKSKDLDEFKKTISLLDKDAKIHLRSTLAEEMYFRRERQWKVFTWSSGIFAVLITGLLIRGPESYFSNTIFHVIISIATTLFAFLSCARMTQDKVLAKLEAEFIAEIDKELTVWLGDLEKKYSPKTFYFGNRSVLWLLCFVLMVLVWSTSLSRLADQVFEIYRWLKF